MSARRGYRRWGVVMAAAVLLGGAGAAQAARIIIDNADGGFAVLRGSWLTGSFGVPWGTDYRWTSAVSGGATAEVEWRPDLPRADSYEVCVWYVAGGNRAGDTPFIIEHALGSDTVRVNQQIQGSRWVLLGRFPFHAGTAGRVRMTNAAIGSVVVADAVRFRSLGCDYDQDGDVDLADFAHFQVCYGGPNAPFAPTAPACDDSDGDGDGDVDLADFAGFQGCFNGPNRPPGPACPGTDPIPPRLADALCGSQFIAQVSGLSLSDREQRIHDEVLRGNVPDFLRSFHAVTVSMSGGGVSYTATFYSAPDYLAIGADEDFVRMPMTPRTAQQIADSFGCVLPTRKMVNDIYAQAAVKLAPYPFNPSQYDITSVEIFYQHHLAVEQQRAGHALGLPVGGAKKDVVVTNLLIGRPDRVAIYGWHRLDGTAIQPLYVGHIRSYVDYSHGIRLVRDTMLVDGTAMRVADVLSSAALCPLLSDEGPITNPRYER